MVTDGLNELAVVFRVLHRLPAYLRRPLTTEECRAVVKRRLEQRQKDFLNLVLHGVYANPTSPNYSLLKWAGCEFGDLQRLVDREGVEGALHELYRKGVYLTVDEYKGRQPLKRGSSQIDICPAILRNPLTSPAFLAFTGGSRGQATRIQLDISCIRDHAVNMHLALAARGGEQWRNAVWCTRGLAPMLWYSGMSRPVERWFMLADPKSLELDSRFLWSARIIVLAGWLAGKKLPLPFYAPVDSPYSILYWMKETLSVRSTPHLWLSPGFAVKLCHAAQEAKIDISGAQFTITGEPITEARLTTIRLAGAQALPDYGSADSGGSIAAGCLAPEAPDDVHVFSDLNAVIQVDEAPFPTGALLVTSLRPTAPFIFLNLSLGDRAVLTERHCGCPLDDLGWRIHMHSIRSFEKLTAGGVTFDDTQVIPLLEERLPAAFGGGPTDYQLVEEEDADGQPCLRLRVHPAVGELDPRAVIDLFLAEIGKGSDIRRNMAEQWRQTGYIRMDRQVPLASQSGKILHLVAVRTSIEGGENGRRTALST